jgi:hypothetical protein
LEGDQDEDLSAKRGNYKGKKGSTGRLNRPELEFGEGFAEIDSAGEASDDSDPQYYKPGKKAPRQVQERGPDKRDGLQNMASELGFGVDRGETMDLDMGDLGPTKVAEKYVKPRPTDKRDLNDSEFEMEEITDDEEIAEIKKKEEAKREEDRRNLRGMQSELGLSDWVEPQQEERPKKMSEPMMAMHKPEIKAQGHDYYMAGKEVIHEESTPDNAKMIYGNPINIPGHKDRDRNRIRQGARELAGDQFGEKGYQNNFLDGGEGDDYDDARSDASNISGKGRKKNRLIQGALDMGVGKFDEDCYDFRESMDDRDEYGNIREIPKEKKREQRKIMQGARDVLDGRSRRDVGFMPDPNDPNTDDL